MEPVRNDMASGRGRGASGAVVPVFVLALFGTAALIFMLQPLFARTVTPLLGGSPAVWNTSMVFFQTTLLGGYFYAHLLQRIRPVAGQVAVHGTLLILAGLALPVRPTELLGDPNLEQPALWLLGVLALSVGAPYLVASATAPLLQAWYARTGRADAGDPYYLYGASNLGSLLGLLSYPVVVEPLLGVRAQGTWWAWGYAGAAVLVLASGLIASRSSAGAPAVRGADRTVTRQPEVDVAPSWSTRAMWLVLAAVPSALLIGVTQHVLTDVASAPFLWVPPLVLYLLTFVIAFGRRRLVGTTTLAVANAGLAGAVLALPHTQSITFDVGLRLASFFVAALLCHQLLADRRPPVARLTEFYNFMSLGGAIGGASTALLAPIIFPGIWEYPLALAATLLFAAKRSPRPQLLADGLLAGAVLALGAMLFDRIVLSQAALALTGVTVLLNHGRPLVAAALLASGLFMIDQKGVQGSSLLRARTFFGTYRVVQVSEGKHVAHEFLHGTTFHGTQWRGTEAERIPLSYHAAGGALHEAVQAALPQDRAGRAVVLGLGAGAMACVFRPGDTVTFIEIDPVVLQIAQDPRYFSYLDVCAPSNSTIVGDGRLALAELKPESIDVMLADAFSSDAVPTHLLTREAVRAYLRILQPDGALVFNVSNRHLAIANEVVRVLQAEGLAVRRWRSDAVLQGGEDRPRHGVVSGVVATRTEAAMDRLSLGAHWTVPPSLDGPAWSDDFVNMIRALRDAPIDANSTRAIVDSSQAPAP